MFFSACVLLLSLSNCASDQSASKQGEPVQGGKQGNSDVSLNGGQEGDKSSAAAEGASMNNAVADGSINNFGSNGGNAGAGNTPTNENAAIGASMNNSTSDPALTAGDAPVNPSASLDSNPGLASNPLNATATPLNNTAPLAGNQAAPANEQAQASDGSAPAQVAPPTSSLSNPSSRAAASPLTNSQMNWPGKGKVKYVTRQITRHSSPNGPVVGEFEQGDHPLIFQNGNWVELHDGSFVRGNGLSDKGVGYNKGRKSWH